MGPGRFAAMMLADMGADVIRVDRYTRGGELPDTERRVRAQDPSRGARLAGFGFTAEEITDYQNASVIG
jgi:crotonobetainyl-CoA:carnitine CoA-transferase CaiB-like acyl-CoA transferase